MTEVFVHGLDGDEREQSLHVVVTSRMPGEQAFRQHHRWHREVLDAFAQGTEPGSAPFGRRRQRRERTGVQHGNPHYALRFEARPGRG
ncbi:MAG: hypothetical protein KDB33_04425 [Acidimicrobiales bacterium]|nr:hypothetical protein [Acidimicrobiales bacterium]